MGAKISSLYAEIGADVSKLKAGLADAKGGLDNLRGEFSRTKLVAEMILKDEASAQAKELRLKVDAMSEAEKRAAVETYKLAQSQQDAAEAEKKHAQAAGDIGDKLAKFGLALQGAAGMAQTAMGIVKTAFDFGKEGAQLDLTRQRFDKLAVSINTTSESLNTKLKAATGGMLTNAQIMEQATQIISLGLAKDESGVVSLAELVTKLGWDMQTVIMTFANDSKMRLDALGLSVSDVDARMAKLQAQGISTDKAFDMAVIEAGQAKLKLLGDQANTTAGDFARAEATLTNFTDTLKEKSAPALAGVAARFVSLSQANDFLAANLRNGKLSVGDYAALIGEMAKTANLGAVAGSNLDGTLTRLNTKLTSGAEAMRAAREAGVGNGYALREQAAAADKLSKALEVNRPLGDLRYLEQDLSTVTGAASDALRMKAAALGSVTSLAIQYAEQENKRAEVETKLVKLEKDIAAQGPVRIATIKNETMNAAELAATQAKLAAQQANLAATNSDLASAQRKKGETDVEYNARMADTRAKAADLQAGIVELSGKLGEHTAAVGGATEQQIKERDALRETLAEMQRTAEIEAAKNAFQSLGKALESGRLSESEYLKVAKQLNDETRLYSEQSLKAATSAVLLNQALSGATSADKAWADILRLGNSALGDRVGLMAQLAAGVGAPETQTGARRVGGETGEGFASGGSFIVPPGYPNDTYPMRVSSGERVTVTPQSVTNHRYGDVYQINDMPALAMLRDAQRRERMSRNAGNM